MDILGENTDGIGTFVSNVSVTGELLSTVYNDQIIFLQEDGTVTLQETSFPRGQIFLAASTVSIIVLILNAFCILYLALRILCYWIVNKPKLSFISVAEIILVIFTLIFCPFRFSIACRMLFKFFDSKVLEKNQSFMLSGKKL